MCWAARSWNGERCVHLYVNNDTLLCLFCMNVIIVYYGLHLLAEGAVDFLFLLPTIEPFSALRAHHWMLKPEKVEDINMAAKEPDNPAHCCTVSAIVKAKWGECDRVRSERGGKKVGRELAVCQQQTPELSTVQSWRINAQRPKKQGGEGQSRDKQQWPDGAQFVLK